MCPRRELTLCRAWLDRAAHHARARRRTSSRSRESSARARESATTTYFCRQEPAARRATRPLALSRVVLSQLLRAATDAEPRVAAASSLDADDAVGSSDAVVDELEFVQHGDVETDTIEGRTDGEHAAYTWSMLSVIGIETEDRAALARSVVGILRLGQVRARARRARLVGSRV